MNGLIDVATIKVSNTRKSNQIVNQSSCGRFNLSNDNDDNCGEDVICERFNFCLNFIDIQFGTILGWYVCSGSYTRIRFLINVEYASSCLGSKIRTLLLSDDCNR
ncbi:hypothetical protein DERF_005882 [Dermatophagoides farinae]|uniref:Uncharacterized protein n=1 Tax=Dermatophagoides farinae TaxID=6954 RepID=A0A922LBQ2_DERFA|nr:hypothetical protein DERF_005882 [Dermatophagoides farinae]